jgi:hypothetical protein
MPRQATIFAFLLGLIITSIFILNETNNTVQPSTDNDPQNQGTITTYTTKQWLTNREFQSPIDPWYNTTTQASSDLNVRYEPEEAKFELLGSNGKVNTSSYETFPNSTGAWRVFQNPSFPAFPVSIDGSQTYGIDQYGWWAKHEWDQNTQNYKFIQTPSVNWKRNYSIGLNLDDYAIKSIYINATINATVTAIEDDKGGLEVLGDPLSPGYTATTYDYARIYIFIENIEKTHRYEVGEYKSTDWGRDTQQVGKKHSIPGVSLQMAEQPILIAYLTSIFQNTIYSQFSVGLGIDFFCEDNAANDHDKWDQVRIKNFDFNFTYEKTINRNSAVSWNQDGETINGTGVAIEEAYTNFIVKTNQTISQDITPNSAIQVFINNNEHPEPIKLWKLNSTWQNATNFGSFDVTSLIQKGINITFSIKLLIFDNFNLNQSISISIDNASLIIKYSTTTTGETSNYKLFLDGQDKTSLKRTSAKYGSTVNLSFVFEDSGGNFLSDATVNILIAGTEYILTQNQTLGHYNITIDTTKLNIGENYLLLDAIKTEYNPIIDLVITIEILPIDTDLQLFINGLNRTLEKAYDVTLGESINVTISYNNTEGGQNEFINDASVILFGLGSNKNLTEIPSEARYNITINSMDLGIGITYLTISVQKQYYKSQSIVFRIQVNQRNSYLDNIIIDGIERTTFEIAWNELFSITVSHNDTESNQFLSGSTVQIQGTGFSAVFIEGIEDKYEITLNSSDLKIGIKYLTITALNVNYSIASQLIVITVTPKPTEIDLYLNSTNMTSIRYISVKLDELVNVSVNFFSISDEQIILGASINLAGLPQSPISLMYVNGWYQTILDTKMIGVGIYTVTITAISGNYTTKSIYWTLSITQRETGLDLYLNNLNRTLERTIQIQYNMTINVSVNYFETQTNNIIIPANIVLKNTILGEFSIDFANGWYQYQFNSMTLGIGVHTITLIASNVNSTYQYLTFTVTVVQRNSGLNLTLNSQEIILIQTQLGENITIGANYYDENGLYLIDPATVLLTRSGFGSELMPILNNVYSFELNTSSIGVGLHTYVITASATYSLQRTIQFTVIVNKRDAGLSLYANGTNITTSKAFEIQLGSFINISASYFDNAFFSLIESATVQLTQSSQTPTIISLQNGCYQSLINTNTLGIGIFTFSLIATSENNSQQSIQFTITVIKRASNLHLFIDTNNITLIKSYQVQLGANLNISVFYFDVESGLSITSATLDLTRAGFVSENMAPDNGNYYFELNTNLLGIGVHLFTISATSANNSLITIQFTLTINQRDSVLSLYLNSINATITRSVEIQLGTAVNISAYYFDSQTQLLIYPASVNLTRTGYSSISISNIDGIYQYNLDTNTLGVGAYSYTIIAQSSNNTVQTIYFTIIVTLRNSGLDLFLNSINSTLLRSISVELGASINVSVSYFDVVGPTMILDAMIQLTRSGQSPIQMQFTNGIYQILIDTNSLGIGVFAYSITASSINNTQQTMLFTITIGQQNAGLDLFLNSNNATLTRTIEIQLGNNVNVSAFYYNLNNWNIIYPATLTLTRTGYSGQPLTYLNGIYQWEILTSQLGVGVYTYSITATSENNTQQSIFFTITVLLRSSDLDLFLNQENATLLRSIQVQLGMNINISVNYFDSVTSNLITTAMVSLTRSGQISENMNPENGWFQYILNTNTLGVGIFSFTITATSVNHTQQTMLFTITINKRDSNLALYANGTNITISRTYEAKLGANLNISLSYYDFNSLLLIAPATVRLSLEGQNPVDLEVVNGYYQITLSSLTLGVGLHTFIITATAINHTQQSTTFTINILRRDAKIDLFLNHINATDIRAIEIQLGWAVNLSVNYYDTIELYTITSATIQYAQSGKSAIQLTLQNGWYQTSIVTDTLGIGIYTFTVTAITENFTQQSILFTITVSPRTAELHLFMNTTNITQIRSAQTQLGSILNISAYYFDLALTQPILFATVELSRAGQTKIPMAYESGNYNYLLNTNTLGIGVYLFTITATSVNNTIQTIQFTLTINQRDAGLSLYLNGTNTTISRSIEVQLGANVNVSIDYFDIVTVSFIAIATVQITQSGFSSLAMNTLNNLYQREINTNTLGIGIFTFTITASTTNHTLQTIQFTLTVKQRDAAISLFFNGTNATLSRAIEVQLESLMNISISYKDQGYDIPISIATVQITRVGSTPITMDYSNTLYGHIIDTKSLGIGIFSFSITATSQNNTPQSIFFTITVIKITAGLDLFLNSLNATLTRSIEIQLGGTVNVSIGYFNLIAATIVQSATVELARTGQSVIPMTYQNGLYQINIDTFHLGTGVYSFTVVASSQNYTEQSIFFTITVTKRIAGLHLFLNDTNATISRAIGLQLGSFVNVSVNYFDLNTELRISSGITNILRDGQSPVSMNYINGQYYVEINTLLLGVGVYSYTISASSQNYTSESLSFTITVNQRSTVSELILNHVNVTIARSIEVELSNQVNVTLIYRDLLTSSKIASATVNIAKEGASSQVMNEVTYGYYFNIDSNLLGIGIHSFTIIATSTNYTQQLVQFVITVSPKQSGFHLYLNTQNRTDLRIIEVGLQTPINVSLRYFELSTFSPITLGSVNISGPNVFSIGMTYSAGLYQYTLNTDNFTVGSYTFSIYAISANHTSQTLSFVVTINPRFSAMDLFINGENQTIIRNYECEIQNILNISVRYYDLEGQFSIIAASVNFSGPGYNNMSAIYQNNFYQFQLNTSVFGFGLFSFTISAKGMNYTQQLLIFTLRIHPRQSGVNLFLNNNNATLTKAITLELFEEFNISINYFDQQTLDLIIPASISIIWNDGNDSLVLNNGLYRKSFDTNVFGTGIHSITITMQSGYHSAQSISFTLTIIPKSTAIELYLQNINATILRSTEIEFGRQLNITLAYYIANSGVSLTPANVSIQGLSQGTVLVMSYSGTQYQILINTNVYSIGIYYLTITASAMGYEAQSTIVTLKITPISTKLELFLNDINSTISPSIEIPLRSMINIKFYFLTQVSSSPISTADLSLSIPGSSTQLLVAQSDHYILSLNVSQLGIGVHFLTLLASKGGYVESSMVIRVTVIQIPANVTTAEFQDFVTLNVNEKSTVDLVLRNSITGEYLTGATMKYNFEGTEGYLIDKNGTGHYTGDFSFKEPGTYKILITVFNGYDYNIEPLELTVVVIDPNAGKDNTVAITVLGILFGVVMTGVVAYMVYFKYPKMVRMIRKVRNGLGKAKSVPLNNLKSYNELIKETHAKWTKDLSKGKINRMIENSEKKYTSVSDVKPDEVIKQSTQESLE